MEIFGNIGFIVYDYGYVRVVWDFFEVCIIDMFDLFFKIVLSGKEFCDIGNRRFGIWGLWFVWFCRFGNEIFLYEVEFVVDRLFGRIKSNLGCLGFGFGRFIFIRCLLNCGEKVIL